MKKSKKAPVRLADISLYPLFVYYEPKGYYLDSLIIRNVPVLKNGSEIGQTGLGMVNKALFSYLNREHKYAKSGYIQTAWAGLSREEGFAVFELEYTFSKEEGGDFMRDDEFTRAK